MAKLVTARKVTRYYVNGRGYASKSAAYVAIAKSELVSAAQEAQANLSYPESEEAFKAFFVGKFPVCAEGDCPLKCFTGRTACRCRDEQTGAQYKSYCNRLRWEWIRARAKELQTADEGGSQ